MKSTKATKYGPYKEFFVPFVFFVLRDKPSLHIRNTPKRGSGIGLL